MPEFGGLEGEPQLPGLQVPLIAIVRNISLLIPSRPLNPARLKTEDRDKFKCYHHDEQSRSKHLR